MIRYIGFALAILFLFLAALFYDVLALFRSNFWSEVYDLINGDGVSFERAFKR